MTALTLAPTVIGICGFKGAGKSVVAQHLVDRYGFVRVRFAGPLKGMVRALGLGEAEVEGDLKEKPCALLGGKTPRHAMQTLGTEWGRACMGESFWVGLWERYACDVLDQGGRVVVDDLRFPNEESAVHRLGGNIIRITRPGCAGDGHESERHVMRLKTDFDILNSATESDLRYFTDATLAELYPAFTTLALEHDGSC